MPVLGEGEGKVKPILRWQYEQVAKCLLLIQGHGSNIECPCSSEGEMCLRKHFMELEALCEETSPICDDEGIKQKLFDLAKEARELRADEELKLCGKESKLDTDIAEWARDWRKPFEQASLVCGVAQAQESPLLSYLREVAVAELRIPAPFGWVGGKRQLSKRIVSLIPPHKTYVEPFCGAASVFWAKEPSEVEVLNDLDPDLMWFYQELPSIGSCDIKSLSGSWEKLKEHEGELEPCEFQSLVECSFGTMRGSKAVAAAGCRSNAVMFHKRLPVFQERIKGVKLHNEDWQKVALQYDSPDTFFYLEPPYHGTSRGYRYGEDQLSRLAETLPKLKGQWLLSYDDDPDVRKAFAKFTIVPVKSRYTVQAGSNKQYGHQLLIANYPLDGAKLGEAFTVCKKIELCHNVEASNKREAVAIARDKGEINSDLREIHDWRAKRARVGIAETIDPCQEARSALVKYLADVKAGHTGAAEFWKGQGEAFSSMCVQNVPGGAALGQDESREVGPYLVNRYEVLGTGIIVYDVWEEDNNDHSTMATIKGKQYGRVGTKVLPEKLAKLAPGSRERITEVMRWQEDEYRRAYGAILEAYPELKNKAVRWSMGEGLTLETKEGEMEEVFAVSIGITDIDKKRMELIEEAVVDTGSTFTTIPASVVNKLNLPLSRTAKVEMADGRIIVRDIYYGRINLMGDSAVQEIAKTKNGAAVVGAVTLEVLGLKVNPQTRQLEKGPVKQYYGEVSEEQHPYARPLPKLVEVKSTTIEKHYISWEKECHKGSIRALRPAVGTIVYIGCLKKNKWDAKTSTCNPNPSVVKTIVLNTKENRDEVDHLKLVHPEVKVNYLPHEVGVEPRVAEGEAMADPAKPELVPVIEAMGKAEEVEG